MVHRLRRFVENKLRKHVDGGRGPPMGWKNRIVPPFQFCEWLWSLFLHFPVAWRCPGLGPGSTYLPGEYLTTG